MALSKLALSIAVFGVASNAVSGLLPWDGAAATANWNPLTNPSLSARADKQHGRVMPNTYIVKLSSKTDNTSINDADPHNSFRKRAQSIDYVTRHEYTDSSLFLGLSVTLSDSNDLQKLRSMENVEKIWPVYSFARPLAVASPMSNRRLQNQDTIQPRASNITLPHITGDIDPASALKMSNVDKLHASGIKGAGIKIAVIDTGVDYRHPSLGGCFGPGCKISFGYDLVGDDYPDTTVTSPSPLATCAEGGHGSHVMGILGMEDPANAGFGLVGVAPEATLGMYRVFGCAGSAGDDVVLAAMLMAAADGADVISMSLGSLSPDEVDNPYQELTETLTQRGIAVIVAAGNDGDLGPFSASSPAIGTSVLAVGSVGNTKYPVTYQLSDSRGRHFRYASGLPIDTGTTGMSIIILADGQATDSTVCFEYEYANAAAKLVDPKTTILAIKVGGCSSTLKAQVAAIYGFKYVMLYSTAADLKVTQYQEYFGLEPSDDATAFVVTAENALSIITEADKNPNYRLFFNGTTASGYLAQSPVQVTGGFMSNYSSFGPSTELNLKPQLSAPGGNILSTWPLSVGGYAIISGTSMSTPFAAGCYALVKSQLPSLNVSEIFDLLMNSASPLSWYYDRSILSSAAHQGSGLIDPHAAINYESLVSPQQLNLAASVDPVKKTLTIKNRSKRSKTYVLTHKAAGLVNGGEYRPTFISQEYPEYATVNFSSASITIQGGASAIVEVIVTPPAGVDLGKQPVYSGYIVVTNNNDHFAIPYVGEPYDPATVNIIAEIVPFQLKFADVNGNKIILVPSGIYPASQLLLRPAVPDTTIQSFSMATIGHPDILFGTTLPCDYIRLDTVPANSSFVPDIYGFNPNITYTDLAYPAGSITTILGLETLSTLAEYEGPFDLIGSSLFSWQDTALPKGDYRVVMRVLRAGRDYDDLTAWNSWMSAVLRFR